MNIQPIFIIGAPRSGTTWLQTIFAQHDLVVSVTETDFFGGYLTLLQKRWDLDVLRRDRYAIRSGLPGLVSEAEFTAALREFSGWVFEKMAERKPGAAFILDKTPHNHRVADLILRLFPDAFFVHIVRDPRSVVASMLAASEGSWAHWADGSTVSAARRWRDDVFNACSVRLKTGNYVQIRYEDLLSSPVSTITSLLTTVGIEVSETHAERLCIASSFEAMKTGKVDTALAPGRAHDEFFRSGNPNSWKRELTMSQIAVVESLCGEQMTHLGYAPVLRLGLNASLPTRVSATIRCALYGSLESLVWRCEHSIRRLQARL